MCALEQTHIDRTSKLKQGTVFVFDYSNSLSEFQSLRDEIKNNTQDEKHALRISLEAAVEKLFKMFQQAQKVILSGFLFHQNETRRPANATQMNLQSSLKSLLKLLKRNPRSLNFLGLW